MRHGYDAEADASCDMAATGTPTDGFPSGNPDNERDSRRLLYMLLLLLGAGAGAILALDLKLI